MASHNLSFLLAIALLLAISTPVSAFGAGNIASLSKIEGHNWRHGDIEDMLKTVAFLKGHKWTSMMIKRVYFGNWLRDYSQAVDVGTLKGVQAGTIRILVWVLAFMSFGYATAEFEVTDERLGTYRPEEHIDNPKDYADNEDARKYDPRLRPPIQPIELAIDPNTGMKNYIANEAGGWATSSGYVRFSFARSIHFGRMYTSGANRGNEEDLCEALRCLGQALHTLEDFGAHTNYVELALQEMGFKNVFPHTGTRTQMNVRGKHVYPLVTGTFGGVDFLHSVIGEATDHITQSELEEMNDTLGTAAGSNKKSTGSGGSSAIDSLGDLLSKVPGTGGLMEEAARLQAMSNQQAASNSGARGIDDDYSSSRAQAPSFQAPPGSVGGPPGPGIPGMNPNTDPQAVVAKIYPILVFRDNVVRTISGIISKIPGLEKLIDTITERVTLFVFSLLAPYIQPIIAAASAQLKAGSSTVVDASASHQYEPWTDPNCTDPTHSLLSKDHFSNILNSPAGQVASAILQYVAPRVIFAWDHPDVPVDQVLNDVCRVFHHPALRDPQLELHKNMYRAVEHWVQGLPDRGQNLNNVLGSESVRAGKNHKVGEKSGGHQHGGGFTTIPGASGITGMGSHSKVSGSPFEMFTKKREMGEFDDSSSSGAGAPAWQTGGQYTLGTHVSFHGATYKCLNTHHADAPDWTPAAAPSLWAKIEADHGVSGSQQSFSPQPQWQSGGYEQQSFQPAHRPQHVQDDGAYEAPTRYQQGYEPQQEYGAPPPQQPPWGGPPQQPPYGGGYQNPPPGPYGQYGGGGGY
ncbi:hypothetical protein FKW77_006845 [Venturia effusa]|uniref:Chitin-binding type-3 domain-containing protein n=1 Tax=Venturia effusa TaxID=50376 RepID=A0A517LFT9_9PEZI|nr:hypothetical protein FKW77_006845 [Venturia effusa]